MNDIPGRSRFGQESVKIKHIAGHEAVSTTGQCPKIADENDFFHSPMFSIGNFQPVFRISFDYGS
jgi:hypothetical protein